MFAVHIVWSEQKLGQIVHHTWWAALASIFIFWHVTDVRQQVLYGPQEWMICFCFKHTSSTWSCYWAKSSGHFTQLCLYVCVYVWSLMCLAGWICSKQMLRVCVRMYVCAVCMCVCVCVCIWACLYVCYVDVRVCICLCVYLRYCMCMLLYVIICMCVCTLSFCLMCVHDLRVHSCVCVCVCVYVHVCARVIVFMCLCLSAFVCLC